MSKQPNSRPVGNTPWSVCRPISPCRSAFPTTTFLAPYRVTGRGTHRRLTNLDVFSQPVTAPDDRDHNVRTTAWSFDPNRDRGTVQMPENQALLGAIAKYPGLFF